jgi:hypothetical protein
MSVEVPAKHNYSLIDGALFLVLILLKDQTLERLTRVTLERAVQVIIPAS